MRASFSIDNCELSAATEKEVEERFGFEEDDEFDYYERADNGRDCVDGKVAAVGRGSAGCLRISVVPSLGSTVSFLGGVLVLGISVQDDGKSSVLLCIW